MARREHMLRSPLLEGRNSDVPLTITTGPVVSTHAGRAALPVPSYLSSFTDAQDLQILREDLSSRLRILKLTQEQLASAPANDKECAIARRENAPIISKFEEQLAEMDQLFAYMRSEKQLVFKDETPDWRGPQGDRAFERPAQTNIQSTPTGAPPTGTAGVEVKASKPNLASKAGLSL